MAKFIHLTAVCYSKLDNGKVYAEEHNIILSLDFINGFTDWVLDDDDFNLEGISKEKYKLDGARVFLTPEGIQFFNTTFFALSVRNGQIGDGSIMVTENLSDIKKQLGLFVEEVEND